MKQFFFLIYAKIFKKAKTSQLLGLLRREKEKNYRMMEEEFKPEFDYEMVNGEEFDMERNGEEEEIINDNLNFLREVGIDSDDEENENDYQEELEEKERIQFELSLEEHSGQLSSYTSI
jgi:hypothetical protein